MEPDHQLQGAREPVPVLGFPILVEGRQELCCTLPELGRRGVEPSSGRPVTAQVHGERATEGNLCHLGFTLCF